jgi:hypothetical protein
MKTTQEIYDFLQLADSKQVWAFARELEATYKKIKKLEAIEIENKKARSGLDPRDLLADKEALRVEVLQHLLKESSKGNAQASDKLAKLAGLGETVQDISIQVISFAEYAKQDNFKAVLQSANTKLEQSKASSPEKETSTGGHREGVDRGLDFSEMINIDPEENVKNLKPSAPKKTAKKTSKKKSTKKTVKKTAKKGTKK